MFSLERYGQPMTMRRLTRQVCRCSLLGLSTALVVGWIFALATWVGPSVVWSIQFDPAQQSPQVGEQQWHFKCDSRIGAAAAVSWTDRTQAIAAPRGMIALAGAPWQQHVWKWSGAKPDVDSPPWWSVPERCSNWRDPPDGFAFHLEGAYGWPLPLLGWTERISVVPSQTGSAMFGGFRRPQWLTKLCPGAVIPYRPIWRGLLVNALVFGTTWFVMIHGYGLSRSVIRRMRGRCPECGYDLRGSPSGGCAECGWRRETLDL